MRIWLALAGLMAVVITGTGLGVVLVSRQAQPVISTQPIGATTRLRHTSDLGFTLAWVDPIGLASFNRAFRNRDDPGMDRAIQYFESINVPDNAPVMLTERRRDAVQIEVLSGPLAGRRGWVDPEVIAP